MGGKSKTANSSGKHRNGKSDNPIVNNKSGHFGAEDTVACQVDEMLVVPYSIFWTALMPW